MTAYQVIYDEANAKGAAGRSREEALAQANDLMATIDNAKPDKEDRP